MYDRDFLKADLWAEMDWSTTDQSKGLPLPEMQKAVPAGATVVDLIPYEKLTVGRMSVIEAIAKRASRRKYTGESIDLETLSYLLWATQGVKKIAPNKWIQRTVPSGGARHPFETYLLANKVEGLDYGLYRYLGIEHQLCLLNQAPALTVQIHKGSNDQFVLESAVVFIWSAIPYRTEWRYMRASAKLIAQDSGHLCQNLYLACESVGLGTCAIGAYDQKAMDAAIGVDGKDEFVIYMAPVGRLKE
jgi:SagB-type dehydrogenase family enzyme